MWQSGFGNGGVGVMCAMAIGELPMFLAGVYLLRRSMDRHTVSDVLRSLAVGGLTVLVFNLLPTYNAVLAFRCIALFGGLSLPGGREDLRPAAAAAGTISHMNPMSKGSAPRGAGVPHP